MQELTLQDIAGMSRNEAEAAIRSRVRTTYLGKQRVLARILGRQKLYLSTTDIGFAAHVMMDGYWEIWLTQFFARIVKPGMTVVDVGANAGYYTLLFGDAVGATGRVLAVEPVPETVDLLLNSVALNGHTRRTQVSRHALGRSDSGEVHVFIPAHEPKNATVVPNAMPGSITVSTTTLNALAADFDRVDLIKIDAEGAEEDIYAGMSDILVRHRPSVLLEFNAGRCRDAKAFLSSVRSDFNRVSWLDFNGDLKPVEDADLLNTTTGEDWLLFLENLK